MQLGCCVAQHLKCLQCACPKGLVSVFTLLVEQAAGIAAGEIVTEFLALEPFIAMTVVLCICLLYADGVSVRMTCYGDTVTQRGHKSEAAAAHRRRCSVGYFRIAAPC